MNGLFSSNANVVTSPAQLMANASRDLFTGLFNAADVATPEQQVMGIMKDVDPSNLESVRNGFNKIMMISPEAAAEYRTQMMPFVTAEQDRIKNEAAQTKAKADLLSAQKKADPMRAQEQKIYENIRKEYSTIFCGGADMFTAGSCQFDPNNPAHVATGFKELPRPEDYFAKKGVLAKQIYDKQTASDRLLYESSDTIQKRFNIPSEMMTSGLSDMINGLILKGVSDKDILEGIQPDIDNYMKSGKTTEYTTKKGGPILEVAPEGSTVSERLQTLNKALFSDLVPWTPDIFLNDKEAKAQKTRDAVKDVVSEEMNKSINFKAGVGEPGFFDKNPEALKELEEDYVSFYEKYKDVLGLRDAKLEVRVNQNTNPRARAIGQG